MAHANQEIYMYVDDSGVLASNSGDEAFVYAGYTFVGVESMRHAIDAYRFRVFQIENSLHLEHNQNELKSCNPLVTVKYKRSLYNVLKYRDSFDIEANISRVYPSIMRDKYSRGRFKDFIVKLAVRREMERLVSDQKILPDIDTQLHVTMDEQSEKSNGYYDLEHSIHEELASGIYNYQYDTQHPAIFSGPFGVKVNFAKSSQNYLVQSCDILANRIYHGRIEHKPGLITSIPNHNRVIFP